MLQPKRGKQEAMRKVLSRLYQTGAAMSDADAEMVVPGAGSGDFYPYVSLNIELEAPQ